MNKHTLQSKYGTLEVFEQGAHIGSWICEGVEQLFLSKDAKYQTGTALRGGVPICFPQFAGFGPGESHGFARNVDWVLVDKSEHAIRFSLSANSESREKWPHNFELNFETKLENRALSMVLSVNNSGDSAFSFGAALHSYFRTEDIRQAKIIGLKGGQYWDKGTPLDERYADSDDAVVVNDLIDRVYFETGQDIDIIEGATQRRISKTGFADVVVWNPWQAGAEKFVDMADDEYLNMICVEAAIVDNPIVLPAGKTWKGEQRIQLL